MLENLPFHPLPGLSSPHVQTILAGFSRPGPPPPSTPLLVPLEDGDTLFCQVSLPPTWHETQKTIVMIHGLGGSDSSNYMIRIGRKLYENGYRVVRINLRGCGSGSNLARLPYHGGTSGDLFAVIRSLKQKNPLSPITLLGFSLGGNIALKLSGELGETSPNFLECTIAVCSPIDLADTVVLLQTPANRLYHSYYLGQLINQGQRWTMGRHINTLYEFDDLVTAPTWGFANAADYYQKSSSRFHIPNIRHPCYLLYTADDPFVDYRQILKISLPPGIKVALCQHGGHMGFLGWAGRTHRYFWLDQLLLNWIENTQSSSEILKRG